MKSSEKNEQINRFDVSDSDLSELVFLMKRNYRVDFSKFCVNERGKKV